MPIMLSGRETGLPRVWVPAAWAIVLATTLMPALEARETAADPAVLVEVEQGDGGVVTGRLERIDAAGVRLSEAGAGAATPRTLPGDGVRAVRRTNAPAAAAHEVVLTLIDGAMLSGADFSWNGTQERNQDGKQEDGQVAVLLRPEGRIELPVGRIRSIAWRRAADAGAPPATPGPAAWQAAIPDGTQSDLVVVGTDENPEFVECAITGVSAESVTVVLDGETIPVKRAKVIGMQWLRGEPAAPEGAAGRTLVTVSGGELRARQVEWSVDALVVDGEIRLPAAMLAGIDYAAGRIIGLAALEAEKLEVEPWFGGLLRPVGGDAILAAFFAPRKTAVSPEELPPAGGRPQPGMIMRPRTVAVWRLPADSRRFRTVVSAAAGPQAADPVMVTVAVDERELFRRQLDATTSTTAAAAQADDGGIPIDVDLSSSRRLTVTVDFVPGNGIGGAVRFANPIIER
ncbi:MAG: hypothetical protein ACKOWG_06520 [Planctomycetia bacterium]